MVERKIPRITVEMLSLVTTSYKTALFNNGNLRESRQ